MRVLVDEMPERKEDCPFLKFEMNNVPPIKVRYYCPIGKKDCDLYTKTGCRTTCSGLLEGAEREVYYT